MDENGISGPQMSQVVEGMVSGDKYEGNWGSCGEIHTRRNRCDAGVWNAQTGGKVPNDKGVQYT